MKNILLITLLSLSSFIFSDKKTTYEAIAQTNNLTKSIEPGKEIYNDFCIQCHLADGKGNEIIPPLAGSDWLVNKRKESIHAVKYGLSGSIKVNGKTYNGMMTPMGLLDEEVADVMNYIMTSWGNKQTKKVTVSEVLGVKK